MNDNKSFQLSISAFITAIIIELGLIITRISDTMIHRINWVLIVISTLSGLFFLYKYKNRDTKIEGFEWVNNLVERVYEVIPQIAIIPPLIVGVIFVSQNISNTDQKINNGVSTILAALTKTMTEVSATECPTSTPISCVKCCVSPTPTNTPIPTPTNTSTPTQTNTPTFTPTPEIIGCVVTYGMNVRKNPGMTDNPSNHAKIWLRNDACVTILKTSTPEWALVQFEGWIRLKKGETEYVVTVTPIATQITSGP